LPKKYLDLHSTHSSNYISFSITVEESGRKGIFA